MSLHSGMGSDGYYDENGHWQRTKLCFVDCGANCTCKPPGGMWVIPVTKDNTDEDKEMTTRNAQSEENSDS